MRSDTGSRATLGNCLASSGKEYNWPWRPWPRASGWRVAANAWGVWDMVEILSEGRWKEMGQAIVPLAIHSTPIEKPLTQCQQ